MLLWLIVGGVIASSPAIYYWIKIIDHMRGKKPDTTGLVTREELAAALNSQGRQTEDTLRRIEGQVITMSRTVEEMKKDFHEELEGLHRSVGKLEGAQSANSNPPTTRRRNG